MRRRTRWTAAAGLAVAMAGVVAAAATDGDSDQELPGSTRDRAVTGRGRDAATSDMEAFSLSGVRGPSGSRPCDRDPDGCGIS